MPSAWGSHFDGARLNSRPAWALDIFWFAGAICILWALLGHVFSSFVWTGILLPLVLTTLLAAIAYFSSLRWALLAVVFTCLAICGSLIVFDWGYWVFEDVIAPFIVLVPAAVLLFTARHRGVQLLGLIGVLVAGFLLFVAYENLVFWRGKIPPEIEVGGLLADGVWVGVPTGGCGAAVFALKSAEIEDVKARGLGALESSRRSRANTKRGYQDYSAWSETPFAFEGPGPFPGASCDLADSWKQVAFQAFRKGGSFYASGGSDKLFVAPNEGVLILSWWH